MRSFKGALPSPRLPRSVGRCRSVLLTARSRAQTKWYVSVDATTTEARLIRLSQRPDFPLRRLPQKGKSGTLFRRGRSQRCRS